MRIDVTINGVAKVLEFEPHEYLLDVLRKYGYLSVKRGCDTGSCGLCTVLVEGLPVLSCALLAAKVEGQAITTIEGVRGEAKEVAEFLVAEGVDQCGFCSPGFLMTILAMKKELTNPSDEQIKHYLAGNLCRCSGYVGQLRGIKKYLEVK
jgi:carbon-monoxide dehydrogenase small subunit